MALSKPQQQVADSDKRFRVLVTGRRFGKTHLAIRELCKAASIPDQLVWYVAPSYRMAKQIVWDKLKNKLLDLNWVDRYNETDLHLILRNGSKICLRGADNSQNLRGVGINFLIIDETQDVDKKAWMEVLRPTLSDTQGSALFTGTPKGLGNWFHDLYTNQKTSKEWDSFQFTTLDGGQVPEQEIESAKNDLDDRTFRQEYMGTFETYSGQVYYNFSETNITQGFMRKDNNDIPKHILVGCDFNIDPMSACIAFRHKEQIIIFDEITIYGSNTDELCQELKTRYPDYKITIYPDPASRQRKTSAGGRTDLSILQNAGFDVRVRNQHTPVRDRINAVNSALKSADGTVKFKVHPACKNVIKSLQKQIYKPGTSIPDNNENLSHMSDAVGYLIDYIYPVRKTHINNNIKSTWTMPTRTR
jgi:hypothetical protein